MTEAAPALPRAMPTPPPSSALAGSWAAGLLRAVGAVSAVQTVLFGAAGLAGASLDLPMDPDRGWSAWTSWHVAYVLGACLDLPLFAAAAIVFLVWLHRARSRQRWFAAARGFSPRKAVLVWLIPAVNVVLPYRSIQELFADEGRRPTDRALLLPLWWACFLLAGVVAGVHMVLGGGPWKPAPMSGTGLWLACARELLLAVSGLLAARFVAEFERRTAQRGLRAA